MEKKGSLILSILTGISILISCEIFSNSDSGNEYTIPEFDPDQSEFTDDEILNATYSEYKLPEYFYNENLGDTSLYYVNTVSIDSLDDEKWIELSTNSFEQAKEWCFRFTYENSLFDEGKEYEKYFEFIRIYNPAAPNNIIKFRTHRTSYLTRDNYDHFNKTDTLGVFKKDDFNDNDSKELIDYLWFISNYNNASSKILSSYVDNKEQTIDIYHYELLIVYGDFGLYDDISLFEKIYRIGRETGCITVTENCVRSLNGRMN